MYYKKYPLALLQKKRYIKRMMKKIEKTACVKLLSAKARARRMAAAAYYQFLREQAG